MSVLDERTLSIEKATRLDQALVVVWSALDRRQIRSLVTGGYIEVNGEKALTVGQRLEVGDVVKVQLLAAHPAPAAVPPPGLALSVVYEDDVVLVVDKPAGIPVRPTRRSALSGMPSATVLQLLEERYPQSAHVGGVGRAGVVTTLGDDESGLILVARDEVTYRELGRSVKRQRVAETYTALVEGNLRGSSRLMTSLSECEARAHCYSVARGTSCPYLRAGPAALQRGRPRLHRGPGATANVATLPDPAAPGLVWVPDCGGSRLWHQTPGGASRPDLLAPERMRFPHPVTHEEVRVESMLPPELFSLLTYMRRPK